MVDLRQSAPYAQYIKSLGWIVDNKFFIRRLGIFGSIAKIQRTELPKNWQEIIRKYHVWMTKFEPVDGNLESSFHQDSWPMLATKTLRVDLKPDIDTILNSFKKDARYCIRHAQGEIEFNNFNNFYRLWKKSAGIKNLWTPPENDFQSLVSAFGKNCFCLTIDNLAGAFILVQNKVAYYYYAGALPEGKKRNLQYLVVWKAMQKARQMGCQLWDFEGIYDSRWPNKGWLGFTHFKKSFGGTEVSFPGSFTRWF